MAAKERLERMAGIQKNKEDIGKPITQAEAEATPSKTRTQEEDKKNLEIALASNTDKYDEKPSAPASSSSGPVNMVPAWGIDVVHRRRGQRH